ncbi:secretoglobin family 2B member 2 precursor [Mus musculus]|uniref:Secretoglobin, family 2B, member 2 n=1 Tax=Mus musculus TaxID=10090 RepID=G5E8B4_MOUSE|nr:secretoglobin family 2B member 2 precursor [Mus musculus]EDL23943.1 mCG147827 [Mus musculus]|eukprot:NP_997145.2 secretoglobin family 2B member 2 precursor [Mus musculus]
MKGTLLLLALLVTGELGFQRTEACIPFFGVYLGILSGNRIGLHTELAPFDPTVEEKEAFEKIQDCYEEEGLKAKTEDMKLMTTILFSSECRSYYTKEVLKNILVKFSKKLTHRS